MNKYLNINFDLKSLFGSVEYVLKGRRSSECAWELADDPTVILKLPRLMGATEVNAVIQKENGEHIKSLPLSWSDLDNEFDVYAAKIDTNELGVGLYYYYIVISAAFGKIYASKSGRAVSFNKDMTEAKFQFSISQFDNTEPSPFSDGIIYHIFVDRFARGRQLLKKEGAVYPEDWSSIPEFPSYPGAPLKNNTFYGGSLDGITERLDYISSLGTTLIYLSPIFESPSNHKYDTADYMKVDEMFGGEKSLVRLIKEAKKRGIGIILDGVFNHTGADSVYFNRYGNYGDGGAYRNKNSEYFDWFEFKHYPEDYTCWWGIEILPRLNTKCTSCMDFFVGKNGVIEKYSKLGIAGFRLDVADELSDAFIKKIKEKLTEINKANILYGEVWEDASNKIAYGVRKKYYLGSELDGVMNYPLRKGLIDYAKNKSTHELEYALTDIINNAPTKIRNMQMNLLGTHDTERIITALVGQSGQERTNTELSTLRLDPIKKEQGAALLRSLYTLLSTLPGIPTVFYGDEAGMEGYSDPFNRLPYPYGNEDLGLIEHYRSIGRIRKGNPVFKSGSFRILELNKDRIVFLRELNGIKAITVFNNSFLPLKIDFDSKVSSLTDSKTSSSFILQPNECKVIVTRKSTVLTIYVT